MKLIILSHNPDRTSFRQRIGDYLPKFQEQGITCTVEKSPSNIFDLWKLFGRAGEFEAIVLWDLGLLNTLWQLIFCKDGSCP